MPYEDKLNRTSSFQTSLLNAQIDLEKVIADIELGGDNYSQEDIRQLVKYIRSFTLSVKRLDECMERNLNALKSKNATLKIVK